MIKGKGRPHISKRNRNKCETIPEVLPLKKKSNMRNIQFGLKKEKNSDTFYNMDKLGDIMLNKSVTKEQIWYYSTYMRYLEKLNS